MKKLILLGLIVFMASCHSHKHCSTTDKAKCEKACEKKCETTNTKTCTKSCTKPEKTKSCCKK
jgi:hypothetical protein